ncbi:NADH:ubiquinone reductase (Na(+)-transporting) subunit B [candidate division KSB1 bacterium]|nr:NADH:ubiquinone reductase (Na(+)-transporting) subunit B [candidate division KSB1 bacterium]
MKVLRRFFDKQEKHFTSGGKLERLFPLYEAVDTFLFTPDKRTEGPVHVRDVIDLKRTMMIVVYALIPTVLMAFYNTGLQANLIYQQTGLPGDLPWQAEVIRALGVGFDPSNLLANVLQGALYFLPVYIITLAAGGFWEVLFASVRRHEVNEGFLVTSLLFPLILPPTIPYWQVALGISFGVVIGKEVFGGVGMNILNPALTARAFLFFAYPAQISGDKVWVAVDGLSKATPLAKFADPVMEVTASWWNAFWGFIPGSMGETSVFACLIGAAVLVITGIGSWRIILSVVIGMVGMSLFFNAVGSESNPMFQLAPHWHLVLGGFAFGTVYMATDPVSAAMTRGGKYVYGLLIGILVVMVRVVNPAFPEGMMLAILFMNVFAPIIDRIYINRNIKRRLARNVV